MHRIAPFCTLLHPIAGGEAGLGEGEEAGVVEGEDPYCTLLHLLHLLHPVAGGEAGLGEGEEAGVVEGEEDPVEGDGQPWAPATRIGDSDRRLGSATRIGDSDRVE